MCNAISRLRKFSDCMEHIHVLVTYPGTFEQAINVYITHWCEAHLRLALELGICEHFSGFSVRSCIYERSFLTPVISDTNLELKCQQILCD